MTSKGFKASEFESSVISYGSQTTYDTFILENKFESSVISYGSQTVGKYDDNILKFESSVISYGSQTKWHKNLLFSKV